MASTPTDSPKASASAKHQQEIKQDTPKASAWANHQQEIKQYEMDKRSKHKNDIEKIRTKRDERMQAMLQGTHSNTRERADEDGYSTGSTKDTPIEGNSMRSSREGNGEKDGISMAGAVTVAVAINKLKARSEARKVAKGPAEAVARQKARHEAAARVAKETADAETAEAAARVAKEAVAAK